MIDKTRYNESRTLSRNIRSVPEDSRDEFKYKVLTLRRHFERFNLNVSELCQWLMGLRPDGRHKYEGTKEFWEFFLKDEDDNSDKYRGVVFDVIAGFADEAILSSIPIDQSLSESINAVKGLHLTPTAEKLFERLKVLDIGHRQILLKATAEWIYSRYQRGVENWEHQHAEWKKEKEEWEKEHPELTEEVIKEFNQIFHQLGIRDKRPKICGWETLKMSRNNCEYAGELVSKKRHSSLCFKYNKFQKDYFVETAKKNKKPFPVLVEKYLQIRNEKRFNSSKLAFDEFQKRELRAGWFKPAWISYLTALGVNEQTVLKGMPHCKEFGVDKGCEYNKHTTYCENYFQFLSPHKELYPLEGLYREWRRYYLSGPSKPSFKYPSTKSLPMPKIFGKGFFKADFDNSVIDLRLEEMPAGEYLRLGFAPWPKDYDIQPNMTEITSININFVGTKARAYFRFGVRHKESRFGISQDAIDELRKKYPRQAQDNDFLNEARKLLVDSFNDNKEAIRILAVDLGTNGGGATVFEGKKYIITEPLKVIKFDSLYDSKPEKDNPKTKKKETIFAKEKGLGVHHAGVHLEQWAEQASAIALKRGKTGLGKLGRHDLRGLTLHMSGMYRDWVRLNANQIMDTAVRNDVDLIVFESQRGFSIPGRDKIDQLAKDEKRRKAFWSQGKIRHKVKEKAVERGMRVIGVPYFNSSQVCSACGAPQEDGKKLKYNKTKHKKFICEKCKKELNSDENAASVLAKVFWGDIILPDPKSTAKRT